MWIFLSHVLEHVRDPKKCLVEMRRILKGVLEIRLPNVYYYVRILRTIKRGFKIPVAFGTKHLQIWDVITMHQLLHSCDLMFISGDGSVLNKEMRCVCAKI